MKITSFFLALLVGGFIAQTTVSAQINIEADGGSFEDLAPWGDGYLGVVQTQLYAVMPKYRQYQYFDENGTMKWNKKVTPFNFNNASVCNQEADYAYMVNMPYDKTALTEKTSKTELLNIYRIDKSGNLTEKAISYTGELKALELVVKKISGCYLAALKDGIVWVGTTDNQQYHVVKVSSDFQVSYKVLDFKWDEKSWENNTLSKIKYALGDKEISLIQMTVEGSELVTSIKTLNLEDLSNEKDVTNRVNFSGYTLYSKSGYDLEYSTRDDVFTWYVRNVWKGEKLYTYPALGSFTNYQYTSEGLKMYAYFRNIKAGTKNQVDKEGFLIYDLDNSEDVSVDPKRTFEFESDNNGSTTHAYHMTNDGKFIFLTKQSKSNIILETSEGEEKKFEGKESFAECFLTFVTGTKREKADNVDFICSVGDHYVGIDFDGISNAFGNTPKAVIYKF